MTATLTVAGSDYSSYLQSTSITVPITNAVPTATFIVDNSSGLWTSVPLFSSITCSLNGKQRFNGVIEQMSFSADTQAGNTVTLNCKAAWELVYLSEGNVQVTGTNLANNTYGHLGSSLSSELYLPYQPVWVSSLNALLMDIGDIFKGLINDVQPTQTSGYRGRLGYDVTNMGIATGSFDIATTDGWVPDPPNTNGYELGLYVKGMWAVGPGSSGKQKTGLDLLSSVCQSNVIDTNGNPQYVDFYLDMSGSQNLLTYFERGSRNSNVTLTYGQDGFENLNLPVDTVDIKNFIVLWNNQESQYPNDGDAWSNYPTTAEFNAQWVNTTTGGSGTATADSSNTYTTGYGTSNNYTATNGSVWTLGSKLSLSGGVNINPIKPQSSSLNLSRNLNGFQFYFMSEYQSTNNIVTVQLGTDTSNYVQNTVSSLPAPRTWQKIAIPIPSKGHKGWSLAGSFDFSTSTINYVQLNLSLVAESNPAQTFWFDQIQFVDNYYYSPAYSDFGPTWSGLDSGLGITYDQNSYLVFGPRIYHFNDFYTPGNSDMAQQEAQNILTSRRGKQSNGKITLFGYNPSIDAIKPGYLFNISAPKNVYIGGTHDSTITSWFAQEIRYDYDARGGFRTTITVNPYYASFGGVSPDTNAQNPWMIARLNPKGQTHMLFRGTPHARPY